MAVSRTMAAKILAEALGGADFTPPTTWYFGVCGDEPTIDGVITNEPATSTGYSRLSIDNSAISFEEPATSTDYPLGYVTNKITFEMAEILSGTEPTVTHFFLSDSSTGDALIFGMFDRPRVLQINSMLVIEPEGVIFEMVNVK